jgi:hypothetical protein
MYKMNCSVKGGGYDRGRCLLKVFGLLSIISSELHSCTLYICRKKRSNQILCNERTERHGDGKDIQKQSKDKETYTVNIDRAKQKFKMKNTED